MPIKHKGLCPFCKQEVPAEIVEKNHVRRDKCICPECYKTIYVCRTPGCDNYSKGGKVYDDELCPSCTSSLGSTVGSLGTMAIGAVITTIIAKKMDQ